MPVLQMVRNSDIGIAKRNFEDKVTLVRGIGAFRYLDESQFMDRKFEFGFSDADLWKPRFRL